MTEELDKAGKTYIPAEMKTQNTSVMPVILSASSLFIALAALIIVFVTAKPEKPTGTAVTGDKDVNIAWVNSDTVWNNYNFVSDVKAELAVVEEELQKKYNTAVAAFQKEYNDYLKTGSALSLAQQRQTEEKLAMKQQSIQELDATLTQQLVDEKTARNIEVHDTIVNFIARYNKQKKFSYIVERSYGGNVLFADPDREITQAILKGLNEEYKAIKKTREKAGK
jgi:outer membrane protein